MTIVTVERSRRAAIAIACLGLAGGVLAGCGLGSTKDETAETQAPQTVVVVSEVPAPTPAPTDPPATLPPATQAPQTVVVVQRPQQSPQTVVRVVDGGGSTTGAVSVPTYVEPGDYCAWLADNGYSFGQAQATYYSLGSPDHMDADKNGVPCETRY